MFPGVNIFTVMESESPGPKLSQHLQHWPGTSWPLLRGWGWRGGLLNSGSLGWSRTLALLAQEFWPETLLCNGRLNTTATHRAMKSWPRGSRQWASCGWEPALWPRSPQEHRGLLINVSPGKSVAPDNRAYFSSSKDGVHCYYYFSSRLHICPAPWIATITRTDHLGDGDTEAAMR